MTAILRLAIVLLAAAWVVCSGAGAARAQDTVLDTVLDIANTTVDAIAVIGIGDQQELLQELAAGETARLTVPVGTTLGFSQGGEWLGEAYVVAGRPDEVVAVPYLGQTESPPAADDMAQAAAEAATGEAATGEAAGADQPQLRIVNSSGEPIVVVAIDADGAQQALGEIAAGETASQAAAPGTTLAFAGDGSWIGDAYVVAGTEGEAVTVPYAAPAAVGETVAEPGEPQVQITNASDQPVTVVAVASDETQQALKELAPGETYGQPVSPGTTLGFAQGGAWLGDAYVVAGTQDEAVSVPYAAPAAAAGPITETFVEASLPPVQITNGSDKPVVVVTIQPDDTQSALRELAPGESYSQPATPGTTFGFAQGEAWLGDSYVTSGEAGEQVTLPFRQLSELQRRHQGPDSVEVGFDNTTGAPVTVAVINEQQLAEPLYELAPGASARFALAGATLWFYRSEEGTPLGDPYKVTESTGQQVSLPYSVAAAIAAAQEGPGSVELQFTNTNVVPIVVSLVDPENGATALYEVPMGQIVVRRALPGTTLWFFRQGEEKPVGTAYTVPDSDAALSLPYNRVAVLIEQQSGPGSVALELRNETYADVFVAMFDTDGRRIDLMTVPYRNAAATGRGTDLRALPGTELYFFSQITVPVDGLLKQKIEGVYKVEAAGPRILYLPFDPEMASQKDPEPAGGVSVMFRNTNSGETPSLLFIDPESVNVFTLGNNLESWRNLAPGSVLFTYGLKNPGDTQFSLIGDAIQIGDATGQTIEVPFYKDSTLSASDLIASGKIDIQAITAEITATLVKQKVDGRKAQVCWRDTYGRGVGTIPRNCPPGQSEDTAGLCYDNCRPGYTAFVTMCVPGCPPGFRNDPLHCFKPPPITRDAYPWRGSDGLSMDGAMARCRARHGANCVTANANTMVYSTCPANYHQAPVITNLCSPDCPPGMKEIGISCEKNTYDRGVGKLMTCSASQQRDAGLCYDGCRRGFTGVGPVCWAQCPANLPVNCGASCAKDTDACALAITDQVTTPLMTAANVALIALTAGAGAAATGAANAAKAAATTAARTGAELAGKAAAKEVAKAGFKAAVKAALRSGTAQAIRGGAGAAAKDLAIDAAVGAVLTSAMTIGFSEKAKVDLREQLKEKVNEQMANQISDAQIDTIVNTAIEGSAAADVDFQFTALDPTGVAEIVRSYNLPLCSELQ